MELKAGSAQRVIAVAHQGGNHLKTLGNAETLGVDLVEADIWLHRGTLELRHSRTLGRLPLLMDGFSFHAGWRPRLDLAALLAAAAPNTSFMLDLKGSDRRLPQTIIEAMRELAPGRAYSVCGQAWDLLDPFLDEPTARVIHSVGSVQMLHDVRSRVREVAEPALSVDFRVMTAERVAALREFAPLVIGWIINAPEDMRRALDWGVNGITSDNFDLLQQLIAPRIDASASPAPSFA